jgi:hypothetical protein
MSVPNFVSCIVQVSGLVIFYPYIPAQFEQRQRQKGMVLSDNKEVYSLFEAYLIIQYSARIVVLVTRLARNSMTEDNGLRRIRLE